MNVFPRNGPEYAQFVAMALQPEPDATLRDLRMQSGEKAS